MVRLITGAGGMMGSHLYEALKDKDVLPTFYKSTLDPRDTITQEMEMLDVLDYQRVKKVLGQVKPDVIYHLAAQSRPDVSFKDPAHTIETNVIGTTNLLQACAELKLKPLFINASSSAVYGETMDAFDKRQDDWMMPPTEDEPCLPLSPYGTSKLAQEHIVKNFHEMYPIDYVNVRIFNCTGPRKINDFVSDICRRVVNEEFPLRVGNLDRVRSIVDVRDLVRGLILCENIKNETINLGSDVCHNIEDVFKMIAGDNPYEVDSSLFRPTDEPIILGNINKAKRILGWEPEISLEQTISDTLDYWRNL
jgi:GDP-4-dehydro-6-deoxy-D-mannose reductase